MHITNNQHKDYYETVERYLESPWMGDVTEEEKKRMIETGEVWELQWYPDTPIGFYKVYGTSFEEILKKANDVENEDC